MRNWLIGALGVTLAGGLAIAQQETTEPETQYGDEVGEPAEQWEQQDPTTAEDPTEVEDPMTDDPMMGEETGTGTQDPAAEMEMPQSVADMSAEELQGLTIVTQDGEEVGEVDRVGESEALQERVVTVDVGGFLGVGARTIAIPLSELEMSSDGRLQTSLTRESIESREEFDEQGFTEESQPDDGTSY